MKNISIMIKPASSLCDMRCKYCFYANVSDLREIKSYGIMTDETVTVMLEKAFAYLESGDSLNIAFQGGEPTLAGFSFFDDFSKKVDDHLEKKDVVVSYAMQTNGLHITEDFFPYLKKYNYLLGISIDLNKDFHNMNRVDAKGEGTFSRILATKKKLEKNEIPHNVLCVLTEPLAKHPQKVWNFILKQKLDFVQFIPCLGELDQEASSSKLSLTSKGFSSFYTGLLPLWFESLQKNHYVSVRFFDDFFHLLLNQQVNSCGFAGNCGIQLVVEGDGSVYPCDFYVLDQWKLGNFHDNSVKEMQEASTGQEFLNRRKNLPSLCGDCSFKNMCGGGCERMSREMYAFGDFCGYQDFLSKNKALLEEVARFLSYQQRKV